MTTDELNSIWVTDKMLHQYDDQMESEYLKGTCEDTKESDKASRSDKSTPQERWKAFRQDLPFTLKLPAHARSEHWWALIKRKREERAAQKAMVVNVTQQQETKKRKVFESGANSFAINSPGAWSSKKPKLFEKGDSLATTRGSSKKGQEKRTQSSSSSSGRQSQREPALSSRLKGVSPLRIERFDGSVWEQPRYVGPAT